MGFVSRHMGSKATTGSASTFYQLGVLAPLAPIRNRNFLGAVSLEDDEGLFEETSSREGLLENPAFDELTRVLHSVLVTAVRDIDAERTRRALKRERGTATDDEADDDASVDQAANDLVSALAEVQAAVDPSLPQAATIAASLQRVSAIAQVIVNVRAPATRCCGSWICLGCWQVWDSP